MADVYVGERGEKMNEIRYIINKLLKTYIHKPIYSRRISKNEIDVVIDMGDEIIKLTARIWQDNYYHELAERARLDIYTYCMTEKEHLYISSQYGPGDEGPDGTCETIKKVITSFHDINRYREKMKKLSMESPNISPGSPRARLNREFYNKMEEWMI